MRYPTPKPSISASSPHIVSLAATPISNTRLSLHRLAYIPHIRAFVPLSIPNFDISALLPFLCIALFCYHPLSYVHHIDQLLFITLFN